MLSYDQRGAGPIVLLLHSSVCDRRMWDPQVPPLVAEHRVVRCDFRGFGSTPAADRPYRDVDDVIALLDHLGAERVAVVGASYGGKVAVELAALRPDRVAAVALLCPALPGGTPGADLVSFGEREDALLADGDIAGAVELNVRTWLGPEADAATRDAVRQMQRHAFEVQLAADEVDVAEPACDLSRVDAPCLVLSGAHDLPHFRAIAAELPTRIAGARHLELPWAGHLPSLERPDQVSALLIEFLAEVRRRATQSGLSDW